MIVFLTTNALAYLASSSVTEEMKFLSPDLDAVAAFAFVVEAVEAVHAGRLVVASEKLKVVL